jgi:hypothetical protein
MPLDGDPRACWVELVLGEAVSVQVHRCAYDAQGVRAAILAAGYPPTMSKALLGYEAADPSE